MRTYYKRGGKVEKGSMKGHTIGGGQKRPTKSGLV